MALDGAWLTHQQTPCPDRATDTRRENGHPLLGTHTAPHFLTDHTPMDSNLLKLTGCWESTTKNGKRMLKGSIRPGLSLLLLENTEATGNQPQWTAFLAPSGEGKGQSDDQAPAASAF